LDGAVLVRNDPPGCRLPPIAERCARSNEVRCRGRGMGGIPGQRERTKIGRRVVRHALAIVVLGVAVAGAVYLGSLHFNKHGHFHCRTDSFGCDSAFSYWTPGRAVWQLPVAIVIATVGAAAAVAIARGNRA
jgi:hypothetical protein